jgi:hypothetical protein
MAEQKDMRGVLFKNDCQREGKQDPNCQGSCTIDGRRYWISAWTNTVGRGKHQGEKYLSIKFRVADD